MFEVDVLMEDHKWYKCLYTDNEIEVYDYIDEFIEKDIEVNIRILFRGCVVTFLKTNVFEFHWLLDRGIYDIIEKRLSYVK